MKWYYKIAIGLAIATIAYLIGNYIPIDYLRPKVIEKEIESSEYFQILIGGLSAMVTFLAVIVALFKEDIRKFWVFSKIDVSIPTESFYEVLKGNISETPDDNQILEAEKYHCKIQIQNKGNITAQDVEIYLESLTHTSSNYPNPQRIDTLGIPLNWSTGNENRINIAPEGKKELCIVELKAPVNQSNPNGLNENLPSKLIIAGHDNNPDFRRGEWTGEFAILSSNAKPVRFKLQVNWNGRWENRSTEMIRNLSIKLIS